MTTRLSAEELGISGRLELMLCRLHQRKYCHLVGNATTGLYLALMIQGQRGLKVGIPNSVCPNVPLAVYLAGAEPVYLDVSRSNLGLSPSALDGVSDLATIIAVHAYGMPCDIESIEAYCAENKVCLIEDAAVAQGAMLGRRPAGSFGAMSVVSFGAGKVVEAGGGGAILTDDKEIYQALVSLSLKLPSYTDTFGQTISELGAYHTKIYNEQYLARKYEVLPKLFKQRALQEGASFLYQFPRELEATIGDKIQALPKLIQTRTDNASFLIDRLSGYESIGIYPVMFSPGAVPWRFNLLVERKRDEILRSLLNSRVKISSWYPSTDLFFECRSESLVTTPVADAVSENILNVWINETIDKAYLRDISQQLIQRCAE
ncbi:MAG: DegT/DnrJ/EryC1/StrS family aminotransferase [Gammaproteobacteria bacterium]|nr:DegT/DnrJ/EryC1/StrS family aminotransferase [Gammaproteobacteria bacterium]